MRHAAQHRREDRNVARLVNAFGLVLLLVFATFVAASLIPFKGWGVVAIPVLAALSATVALATARASRFAIVWGGRLAVVSVALAIAGAVAGGRWFFGASALIEMLLLA